ncbi:MAG: DNA replication/repair protein RecF [Clostridia bacterium]|nr:DNA replication/repair protein RecF [Clostridia bacterium]
MLVTGLRLHSYRSYDELRFEPAPRLNVIVGANAAGKTNVLEAICLCAIGRSFRTRRDQELINMSASGAYVGLELENRSGSRRIEFRFRRDGKQVLIDGKGVHRMGELMGILNAVLFSPEDLSLVKDTPEARRRFMDMELCQLRPAFFYKLQQYNAALKQRGALLRTAIETGVPPDESHLDMWDDRLTELGGDIMLIRREFMDELSTLARDINRRITGGREELYAFYKPNVSFQDGGRQDVRTVLSNALYNSREEDIRRGFTTRGPHRDDVGILIGDCDVRVYGSQGQQRTAALSMKLSEIALMRSEKGESPVLLLDDVLSELDGDRQRELLSSAFDCQCILTTTSLDGLSGVPNVTAFECADGTLTRLPAID